ncbi:hypothetical protein ACOSQ3_029094 [Xanthoceras sorbifolium]
MLSGCSGLGVAVRNASGIAVFTAAVPLKFYSDIEVAEARAILAGIQLAAKRGLLPLLVEMDSLNVSHLYNGYLLSRSDPILGKWNSSMVPEFFLLEDQKAILSIPSSLASLPDDYCWHYDSFREFSVKSGYRLGRSLEVEAGSSGGSFDRTSRCK